MIACHRSALMAVETVVMMTTVKLRISTLGWSL